MTPTLTGVSRDIARIRDLPVEDRRAAAVALINDVDSVLDERVTPAVAWRIWAQLARHGTGRPLEARPGTPDPDPGVARAAALRALSAGDPLTAVAEASRHDEEARRAADRARAALRAAVVGAVTAGSATAHVAAAAGISRQNIYEWVGSH